MKLSEMLDEFCKVTGQTPNDELYSKLIHEEYDEWLDEYKPAAELKELADMVYVIFGYAKAKGWDLEEAVKRVHENNVGRCKQSDGSVKYREDGKVIKNKDYPKVNLEDLV